MAPSSSVTVKGMVTVPLKFAAGVKTRLAASAGVSGVRRRPAWCRRRSTARPAPTGGSVVTVTDAMVPSMSVPVRSTAISVSSSPDEVDGVATGGSLMSLTVMTSLADLWRRRRR